MKKTACWIYLLGLIIVAANFADAKRNDAVTLNVGAFFPMGHYEELLEQGWNINGAYFLPLSGDGRFGMRPNMGLIFSDSKLNGQNNTFLMPGLDLIYKRKLAGEVFWKIQAGGGYYMLKSATGDWLTSFFMQAGGGLDYVLTQNWELGLTGGYHYFMDYNRAIQGYSVALGTSYHFGAMSQGEFKILSIRLEDFFCASYQRYYQKPLGNLVLKNSGKDSLENLKLSFYVHGFMTEKTTSKQTLPVLYPGKEATLPIYAFLDKNVKYLETDTEVMGVLEIEAVSGKIKNKSTQQVKVKILGKNSMVWELPERFGTFITPSDQLIVEYTRAVLALPSAGENLPRSLTAALKVFSAFQKTPLIYQTAPKSASKIFAEGGYKTDYVQYPRETLLGKTGNCADLAALYLSSLESVGIATAFIVLPGHVIPLFEAQEQVRAQVLEYQGKRWIPIEVTLLNQGFSQAWKAAFDVLKNSRSSRFMTTLEATYKHPPFSFESPASLEPNLNLGVWEELLKKEAGNTAAILQ